MIDSRAEAVWKTPVVRRAPLLALVGVVLAGCGTAARPPAETLAQQQPQTSTFPLSLDSGESGPTVPATTAQGETGASTGTQTATGEEPGAAAPAAGVTVSIFVEAAARKKPGLMWELLSVASQARLGPTEQEFTASQTARRLEQQLGSLAAASSKYEPLLAVHAGSGWAVAAIVATRNVDGKPQLGAFAAALREESGAWKLELGGPISLVPIIPASIPAGSAPVLGMQITAPVTPDEAALWIDGRQIKAQAAAPGGTTTVIGGPSPGPLAAGAHVGVGYARAGGEASAISWTFDTTAG